MKPIETEKLEKNIFSIKEKYYKEHANLYLAIGENENLLIDTGTGILDIREYIEKISSMPVFVLNTHSHYDHCGGNKFFEEVHIHESEKEFIEKPTEKNTASFFLSKKDFLFMPSGFDPKKYSVEPCRCAISLKDGQKIEAGDFVFHIIHLPGHSPGSICLYDKDMKIIFSGDVVYNGKIFFDLPFSDKRAYLKSLRKISKIDVEKCFPGHNEILGKRDFYKAVEKFISLL